MPIGKKSSSKRLGPYKRQRRAQHAARGQAKQSSQKDVYKYIKSTLEKEYLNSIYEQLAVQRRSLVL